MRNYNLIRESWFKPIYISLVVLVVFYSLFIISQFIGRQEDLYLDVLLFCPWFLLIIAASMFGEKYKSFKKGRIGEDAVASVLFELAKLPGCFIYNDIVIPGRIANIDHVVVSRKGVFVIETKNHTDHYKIYKDEWYHKDRWPFSKYEKITWKSPLSQAKSNANNLKEYLAKVTANERIFVEPVVVMVSKFSIEEYPVYGHIISITDLKSTVYSDKLEQNRISLINIKHALDQLNELNI
jgi:hypothetical protein